MDQDLVSFVLRFVREAGEDQQARWRGVIKHVQSNTETSFTQFSEALEFMQSYVNDVVEASFQETRKLGATFGDMNPFMETARLWGDFMPRYAQMMMDSMEKAASTASGRSVAESMEQAMDATLAAWGMPVRTGPERADDSLDAMTQQLAEMTAKMADLEKQIKELEKENKENTK
jgi:hypothetical protein